MQLVEQFQTKQSSLDFEWCLDTFQILDQYSDIFDSISIWKQFKYRNFWHPYIFGWWHLVAFIDHYTPAMYWLNIPYHYFKFDYTHLYFMVYCKESLPQPFSNWKLNWRWQDLNPGPSKYQSNIFGQSNTGLDQ